MPVFAGQMNRRALAENVSRIFEFIEQNVDENYDFKDIDINNTLSDRINQNIGAIVNVADYGDQFKLLRLAKASTSGFRHKHRLIYDHERDVQKVLDDVIFGFLNMHQEMVNRNDEIGILNAIP